MEEINPTNNRYTDTQQLRTQLSR